MDHPPPQAALEPQALMMPLNDACAVGDLELVKTYLAMTTVDMNQLSHVNAHESDLDIDFRPQTPLFTASSFNRVDVVELLVTSPAVDVNCPSGVQDTLTPLFVASEKGYTPIVRLLMSMPRIDSNVSNRRGITPLYMACKNGHVDVVRVLLQAGADASIVTKFESTALLIAAGNGHAAIVTLLLHAGHQPPHVNISNQFGRTSLAEASIGGHERVVRALLAVPGIDVNTADNDRCSPLLLACKNNCAAVARMLLAVPGIDVNGASKSGEFPLYYAAKCGRTGIMQQLVDAVHDIDRACSGGQTALFAAAMGGMADTVEILLRAAANMHKPDAAGTTPLSAACAQGHVAVVRVLLRCDASALNATNLNGDTPLMHATRGGHLDVVRVLLAHSADVALVNQEGQTPLHMACAMGYDRVVAELTTVPACIPIQDNEGQTALSLVQHLKSAMATEIEASLAVVEALDQIKARRLRWNYRFHNGRTLLALAALRGNVHVMHEAIQNGADLNLQDNDDNSALALAVEGGFLHAVKVLASQDKCSLDLPNKLGVTPFQWAMDLRQFDMAHELLATEVQQTATGTDRYIRRMVVDNLTYKGQLVLELLAPHLTTDVAVALMRLDLPIQVWRGGVVDRVGHSFSWSTFLDPALLVPPQVRCDAVRAILAMLTTDATNPIEVYKALAYATDRHGRQVMQATDAAIRQIFQDLLFFCGRYEIADTPPIHVSATSVVVHALDHGLCLQVLAKYEDDNGELDEEGFVECNRVLGRQSIERRVAGVEEGAATGVDTRDVAKWKDEFAFWDKDKSGSISKAEFLAYCQQAFGGAIKVVLKFMRHADEHAKEVRNRRGLDGEFVLGLLPSPPASTFREAVAGLTVPVLGSLQDYPHVLAMPYADRSLEDIYLKERPSQNYIRTMLEDVAKGLQHVHDSGLVHGDVKKPNVLRVQHQLKLIDFDAAIPIETPAGAKTSSGVLPPEMFHHLNDNERAAYQDYWRASSTEDNWASVWSKARPRNSYVVKSYSDHQKQDHALLPYELVAASPSLDMWSFGCMMYQMLSGEELVATDINQDVVADRMDVAANWTDANLKQRVQGNILDEKAQDLLLHLLVVDPSKRWSAAAVLGHGYFTALEDQSGLSAAVLALENAQQDTQAYLAASLKELQSSSAADAAAAVAATLDSTSRDIVAGVFDMDEVDVPTSFVVLPFKIHGTGGGDQTTMLQRVGGALQDDSSLTVEGIAELIQPKATLYLYLIDEATNQVVVPYGGEESVYPIEITQGPDSALSDHLPLLRDSFRVLQTVNSQVPWWGELVDSKWMDTVESLLGEAPEEIDFPLETAQDSPPVRSLRGPALRQFKQWLATNDPDHTFAGLSRKLGANERVVWTKKPSPAAP